MSRWHDRSPRGRTAWRALPPEERAADRLADILAAAGHLRDLVTEAPSPLLPDNDLRAAVTIIETLARALMERLPPPQPSSFYRDGDTIQILDEIDRRLNALGRLPRAERDAAHDAVERLAAPWVLVFFYEIRYLESFAGVSEVRK
jgi:hypothetical protein